ncbi:hypothetical protein [Streptomyces sp. SAJ15]|uniref:hypothetical protein n=1 Tax=Streptomyces sp. SAJ15 TaxID=2011095 RepID=UPI001642E71D|nr:hypothetical protein [Streptomyces sp. SAJ15]
MYPRLFTTPGFGPIAAEIDTERAAQDRKWGEQNHPNGTGPRHELLELVSTSLAAHDAREICQRNAAAGTVTWRDILTEEVCEALTEDDPAALRTELVQVAAVAFAWIAAIDRRTANTCAHCGDPITGTGHTWVGPLPAPGTNPATAPRYHLDRPECRAAADA